MNPFEMVVAIIVVVTIGSVLRARYGVHTDRHGREVFRDDSATRSENARLQGEVSDLKERIKVLERVVTDNESGARIDREIEKLRDKNRV